MGRRGRVRRRYDVEASLDGGPFSRWLSTTAATAATYSDTPGHSYRFQVRATDRLGNTSGYVASDPVAVTTPPAPNPEPPPPVRAKPGLKLKRVAQRGTRLYVSGSIARRASGSVLIAYDVKTRRGTIRSKRRVAVRSGRLKAVLKLSRAARSARRGRLMLSYAGDARYLPQTLRRAVKGT